MTETQDQSSSRVTMIVAVLLLVTMVALSVAGDRDDKAWTFMTDQISGWFEGGDGDE